jgi:hypothetical protein
MKKTISGVLLALTAVFALVACGKKKKTTSAETTKKGTEGTTTKAIPAGNGKTIEFYCWNNEFQTRLRTYYKVENKAVENITPTIDLLGDGTKIKWTMVESEGGAYQKALDEALNTDAVDMFCFEADYAKKYIENAKVAEMSTLGVDQSKQYQYTVDAVTNSANKVVGSSWQACPGAIAYNDNVAKAVFGDAATLEAMDTKLKTRASFDETAAALEAKHKNYAMMIGPADWYRVYGNNLSGKMYDAETTTITVDENIFKYAVDTKAYDAAGYLLGDSSAYGLWGNAWNASMAADTPALTMFVCPWFTDFCMAGNCPAEKDADGNVKPESQPWRVVEGYASWFWGGTWLTATKKGIEDDVKKTSISNIIKTMTTDQATLKAISDGELDFTNNKAAMDAKAADTTVKNAFFGGQNVYAIYAKSVMNASLANASDYDQQITENFQSKFLPYIQGKATATACWTAFETEMKKVKSTLVIAKPSTVTIGEEIEIAVAPAPTTPTE